MSVTQTMQLTISINSNWSSLSKFWALHYPTFNQHYCLKSIFPVSLLFHWKRDSDKPRREMYKPIGDYTVVLLFSSATPLTSLYYKLENNRWIVATRLCEIVQYRKLTVLSFSCLHVCFIYDRSKNEFSLILCNQKHGTHSHSYGTGPGTRISVWILDFKETGSCS
jgi:hypothetical protein